MNYAIEILKQKRWEVESSVSKADAENFPESAKLRDKRMEQLDEAIANLQQIQANQRFNGFALKEIDVTKTIQES